MDGRSARDVVLKLALGELDAAFRRAEEVRESLDLAAAKVEGALQVLPEAGLRFAAQVGECTKQAKLELTQFIEKRANSTLSTAVYSARAQMRDAAVLAFSEQLTPIVRDVARCWWAWLLAAQPPCCCDEQPGNTSAAQLLGRNLAPKVFHDHQGSSGFGNQQHIEQGCHPDVASDLERHCQHPRTCRCSHRTKCMTPQEHRKRQRVGHAGGRR